MIKYRIAGYTNVRYSIRQMKNNAHAQIKWCNRAYYSNNEYARARVCMSLSPIIYDTASLIQRSDPHHPHQPSSLTHPEAIKH